MATATVHTDLGDFVYRNARVATTPKGVEFITGKEVSVPRLNDEQAAEIRDLHRKMHQQQHGNLDEWVDGIRLDHGFEIEWTD